LDVAVALTTGIPLCAHQSREDTELWEERVRDHPLWELATAAVGAGLIRTDYESTNPEVTPGDFLKWRIRVTSIPMPEEALRCFSRLLPNRKEDAADKALQDEQKLRFETDASALRTAKVTSILVAILLFVIFELVVHCTWRWEWLLSHSNSYGLQGCLFFMTVFGIVGLWVRPWRNALWVTGLFTVGCVALALLGGQGQTH
jgi:NADH:ubiquinone oxidoreductase subunit 3 (subunit A)